jgi:hypothetical protein
MELEVLVTVKTYPLPSEAVGVREHVCTAGVLRDGSFVRLYPIDYRYRPYWEWYKKYDWIRVEAMKAKHDPRPESYRPDPERQIVCVGHLDTRGNWGERRRFVLAKGMQTMCELQRLQQSECSLGIVRPREVLDFRVEDDTKEWKPRWARLFKEELLFGPQQKPLEKIPYKFSYEFLCADPSCNGHTMMITDWEVGQLYRRMRDKFGDEHVAVSKVRDKFLGSMCAPSVDTHFFVGTVLEHGSWIILGVFCPKKTA